MADRPEKTGGFWEFVKNPEYRRSLLRQWRRGRKVSPDALDETAIRDLIQGFLTYNPDWDTTNLLRALGTRAQSALVEALRDPRFSSAPDYSESVLDGSPLKVVCGAVGPLAPPEAVEPLAALVRHPSSRVRELAAYTLGYIANDDCVEPIGVALNDPDEDVRTYAAMGIPFGVEVGRHTPGFARGMFDRLTAVLDVDCWDLMKHVPRDLMMLDPVRGAAVLQDPIRFHAQNPSLYQLLEALNEYNAPIPGEKLMALLEELRPQAGEYPAYYSCANILRALARQKIPGADVVIRAAREWGNDEVRQAAAEALCTLIGAADPLGVVLGRHEAVGFRGLTRPQKVYYVIYVLSAEVRNGGFAQYFVNSSGNHANLTVKALREVGAANTAAIVQRALDLFGPDGPDRNRDRRHPQLAALTPEQDAEMDRLNTEFYTDPDDLDAALADYVRSNREHFVADEA
ncbi:MAG: DMP19 family protein [Gemmataceae bacterium]